MGEHAQTNTLKGMAEHFGLSVSTISRILSGQAAKYRISTATEEKVLQRAKELKFTPNQLARGLRLKQTNTIGLIIPDISNPFFATVARHIERDTRKRGYSIFLCDSDDTTEVEKATLLLLRSRKVDGVIISSVGQTGEHLLDAYESGLPMAIVDRCFPELPLPSITSDSFGGGKMAVDHLIENGHRDIACVCGLPEALPSAERLRGYKAALSEAGISFRHDLIVGEDFSIESGYRAAKALLSLDKKPTAIFASGYLICLGVLQALQDEGMSVPGDISVLSFDDQPSMGLLATPITTIDQQCKSIAAAAVEMLFQQINAKARPDPEIAHIPTKLVERKSVAKK